MGLIDPRDTLAIADRIGKRYYFTLIAAVSGSPDSSSTRGSDFYAMCHICPDGDPQVEIATLSNANTSDSAWNTTTDPWVIASSMMGSISSSYSIIGALTQSFSSATSGGQSLITGGWNQYLETADTTGTDYVNMPTIVSTSTGVRVSEYFRRVSNISGLRARNVFYDSPNFFEFGLITGTGGSSVTYTAIGDFGDGTTSDLADGSKFAATRLRLLVPVASKWDDATTIRLTVITEPDGASTTVDVTLPGSMTPGMYELVGLDEAARYTKVTAVEWVSGSTTLGDSLVIQNVFERVIEL